MSQSNSLMKNRGVGEKQILSEEMEILNEINSVVNANSQVERMNKNNKIENEAYQIKNKAIQNAAKVFSVDRNNNTMNPYHIQGDIQMYTQKNIEIRKQLSENKEIIRSIQQILQLYQCNENYIEERQYKKFQKQIALIMRPDIQQDELDFVVEQDWQHDSKGQKHINLQNMVKCFFELVDVWTLGTDPQEYVTFCKLLRRKLQLRIHKYGK